VQSPEAIDPFNGCRGYGMSSDWDCSRDHHPLGLGGEARPSARRQEAGRVDLGMMQTVGDLQGGLEEAERVLGYTVTRAPGAAPASER
jgi:hypothetical protein